jgi:DNA-binding transcriptional regulator GbsR (MarR family)
MADEAFPRISDTPMEQAQDQFILEWGRMSSSWGINRTMAQIHALLYVSPGPLTVNEIMTRLHVSRGNASMNLRELMEWGLVRRFRRPGDRKDTYISESDPYQMFVRVVRERKRRELDPTADVLRECLSRLPEQPSSSGEETVRNRLSALLEVFDLVDAAFKQIFASDESVSHFRDVLSSDASAEKS